MTELEQLPSATPSLPPLQVLFRFGTAIPADLQGVVMLACELALREAGVPAECYKDVAADDSKRRREMTAAQREAL